MVIALLLAAALTWWLHKRGELLPNFVRFGGSAAVGLVAVRLLETGRIFPALLAAAAAWGWWVFHRAPDPAARARALLGVGANADAAAIERAWRLRIAAAHPDAGGTDAAARAVTEARDVLLGRLGRGR